MPPPLAEVVVTMVKDLPAIMATGEVDVPVEEEALPTAEERSAKEPAAEPATTLTDIPAPMWNLGERIPIAP
jgi:hypothetical protein